MRLAGFDHAPGAHCGSTFLQNLSDYYGWGFDEPTCFGLVSGLGFHYRELPESPHRLFVGRPLWLERAFFDTPGVGTDGTMAGLPCVAIGNMEAGTLLLGPCIGQ